MPKNQQGEKWCNIWLSLLTQILLPYSFMLVELHPVCFWIYAPCRMFHCQTASRSCTPLIDCSSMVKGEYLLGGHIWFEAIKTQTSCSFFEDYSQGGVFFLCAKSQDFLPVFGVKSLLLFLLSNIFLSSVCVCVSLCLCQDLCALFVVSILRH